MTTVRSVCVYCGASVGNDPRFAEGARRLGTLLARQGITLVFGGGRVGLMGAVADAALAAGGRVVGVIPTSLKTVELAHPGCSELIVTASMHERKERMFQLSDGFIALPGGIGTLEETIEVITWRQLRFHDKPIVIIDDGGYWQPLRALFDATVAAGFAHGDLGGLFRFVPSPEDAVASLAASPMPRTPDVPAQIL
ncbi:MAG: TIGR00730 family Rossman fold protein [Gemmatimonas sp.]